MKGLNRLSRIPIVAIVDDDEAIRDALSELLMLEGFDCHPFERASGFLAEVEGGTFDCLLTDMRMPGMSGLELLEHLHDRGLDLPTIVLTSVVDERCRARSLALGARAWLSKPIADNILLHELKLAIQGMDGLFPQGSVDPAMDVAAAGPVMDEVVRSGMGIVTLPTANLFLQGCGEVRPTARGLTRVAELVGRGVPLASASDNIQDAFVPIGSGDVLELARWTILAGHLLRNEPALAFDMITRVPARLLGLGVQDIAPGEWANFLVTEMSDVTDLVRTGPLQRTVFYRGRVV